MPTDWSDSIVISDLSDEPALSDELAAIAERLTKLKGKAPHVVLNFAFVSYVNSSNLAQLLKLRQLLTERGRALKLCSVSDEVRGVLSVTGLDKVFRFAPDPMTALASLQIDDENTTR